MLAMNVRWLNHFFLLSEERGPTSRENNDIPTRLAPREPSILCRQTLKFIKKRGKTVQEEGGLGQDPRNQK